MKIHTDYVCITSLFVLLRTPGETSEDMETSSETNEGPPVQTKDTLDLGVEQNPRKTGIADAHGK